MRTPITLQEFLFTLNQDEDVRIRIIDYQQDKTLYSGWKTDLNALEHKYDKWLIQDFICIIGGLEITIVESEEELF